MHVLCSTSEILFNLFLIPPFIFILSSIFLLSIQHFLHPKISRTSSDRAVSTDKKTQKGARLRTRSSSEHARPVRLGAAGRSMSRIARMGLDDDDDDDDGDGKRKATEE